MSDDDIANATEFLMSQPALTFLHITSNSWKLFVNPDFANSAPFKLQTFSSRESRPEEPVVGTQFYMGIANFIKKQKSTFIDASFHQEWSEKSSSWIWKISFSPM